MNNAFISLNYLKEMLKEMDHLAHVSHLGDKSLRKDIEEESFDLWLNRLYIRDHYPSL